MSRRLKPASVRNVDEVQTAMRSLRLARELLVRAGATRAANKVRAAIKSTDGAIRHVHRRAAVQHPVNPKSKQLGLFQAAQQE